MARLPPHWHSHFHDGTGIRVAACTADGRPEVARGLAAQQLDDGRIELLLPFDAASRVLDAIASTGQVAVTLGVPLTHRSLHLKGRDAVVEPSGPQHTQVLEHGREAFFAQVLPLGFTREQMMTLWFSIEPHELACVRFSVSGAWDQTPGPGAGQPVELLP
jgi:hypothetical protein